MLVFKLDDFELKHECCESSGETISEASGNTSDQPLLFLTTTEGIDTPFNWL